MSILNKYKRYKDTLLLIMDRYWDFVLSMDKTPSIDVDGNNTNKCLITYIDTRNKDCITKNGLVSLSSNVYEDAVNNGITLENIGFTGLDNGIIKFDKDNITDEEFMALLTGIKLSMNSGDTRLYMNLVDGNTKTFSYPACLIDDETDGRYYALSGGFLQGCYRYFGYDYNILPQYIDDEWGMEFTLRPKEYFVKCNALNKIHPENEGIFFYMGPRAENKFSMMYGEDVSKYPDRKFDGDDFIFNDGYFSDIPTDFVETATTHEYSDIVNERVDDSEGNNVKKSKSDTNSAETDNKYLLFNRTKTGYTVDTWSEDVTVKFEWVNEDKENKFLTMHRAKGGKLAKDILNEDESIYEDGSNRGYDIMGDILDNAFALKINDDMSIGYRYMVKSCDNESGYEILEEKSFPNIIKPNEWNTIYVKFRILDGHLECGKPLTRRKMKIYIYVNGYLKFVSKELDEFNFRELNDSYTKQEGVPFNISLGGGTQGLCDSIWTHYKDTLEKVFPLEQNFGGSFIGDIRTFKFYNCPLQYNEIKNNFLFEKKHIKNG